MQTKLTLRLEEALIEDAKAYAAQHGRSLSQLVADYFSALAAPRPPGAAQDMVPHSPLTDSLTGLLRGGASNGPHDPYPEHIRAKHLQGGTP